MYFCPKALWPKISVKCSAPASQLRGRCFEFEPFYYETESFQIVKFKLKRLRTKQNYFQDINSLVLNVGQFWSKRVNIESPFRRHKSFSNSLGSLIIHCFMMYEQHQQRMINTMTSKKLHSAKKVCLVNKNYSTFFHICDHDSFVLNVGQFWSKKLSMMTSKKFHGAKKVCLVNKITPPFSYLSPF